MTKQKRTSQKRKRRFPIVDLAFDRDVAIAFIHVDDQNRLTFKDEEGHLLQPSVASIGEGYLRPRKPKVLRQAQANPTEIRLDVQHVLRNHEATLAVDTTYYEIGGCRLCVSASILISYQTAESRRFADFSPQASLVFVAPGIGNPERFGWWDIIQRFSESTQYSSDKVFGLVVDSDLNEIAAINDRKAPVWEQQYLPAGFQIVYASADSGGESYINQAIKMCDKLAARTLSEVLAVANKEKIRDELGKVGYHRICYVNIEHG